MGWEVVGDCTAYPFKRHPLCPIQPSMLSASTKPRPTFVLQMRRSSDNLHPSLPRHSVKSTILPRGDAALLPQSIDLRSAATVIYPSRSSCSLAAHYDIRLVPCDASEKGAACCSSLGLTSSLSLQLFYCAQYADLFHKERPQMIQIRSIS